MTAHQISLRMSPIGASIARFAAIRQLDRVYGRHRSLALFASGAPTALKNLGRAQNPTF